MNEALIALWVLVIVLFIGGLGFAVYCLEARHKMRQSEDKRVAAGLPIEYVRCSGGCGREVDKRVGLCSTCAWEMISTGS